MKTRPKKTIILNSLLALLVMAAALFARLPSAVITTGSPEADAAYTREDGTRYMTDPDSYYHVRLVNQQLAQGRFGTGTDANGTEWDSRSFWPEGRSAEYQPGIVWLTVGAWKTAHALFGTDLYTVEWTLAPILSMFAALAAYLAGCRMSGKAGGFVSGILVSCSSAFVIRTTFGRFDTDMFVVLMDLLLILFMTEALRAETWRNRVLHAVGFSVSAFVYSLCWAPESALLFTLLTLCGGLLYNLALLFSAGGLPGTGTRIKRFFRLPSVYALFLCALLSVSGLLLRFGPSLFLSSAEMVNRVAALKTSGVLPDALSSISELQTADIVPDSFLQYFSGYLPGRHLTLLNGVGGLAVALISIAALVWLGSHALPLFRRKAESARPESYLSDRCSLLYFCVMGFLFASGLYATGKGLRFIEFFAVPVGLLAGSFIGWFAHGLNREAGSIRLGKAALSIVLCVAAVIPTLSGSIVCSQSDRPSVSDVSAAGMRWIRENASDPDAVIASWWDLGYYYESESGHPCLWDGGSAESIRAILVAKALTSDNRELSGQILRMLSGSGNSGIELLAEYTDIPKAFDTLWEILPLSKEETVAVLTERLGMAEPEAARAEALLHPEPKETYLVLTGTMMLEIGWFEYYANWDFTGRAAVPVSTLYNYTPDGYSLEETEKGREYLEKVRSRETIWRLAVEGEEDSMFTLVFGGNDGVESMQIWRLNV